MTVELHVFIEINMHIMTMARQVVACQIDQHHMFGILLGVVAQVFGILAILIGIACPRSSTGNGVDKGGIALYAAMGFG